MTNAYQSQREEKLIGVEMEFFGVQFDKVVDALNEAGIKTSYKGYTHQVLKRSWKLVTDVSVNSNGTGLGKGLELVSPPLPMAEMERQLKIATDVLNELGAKVDRTCGVHVHHEIDDLNASQIKNIYTLYAKHVETIDAIMPKSRRADNNQYCRGLDAQTLANVASCETIQQLQRAVGSRYKTLNFTSYVKYGTIEFRQHSGSTDFEKIMSWIRITQALVHTAATKKRIKPTLGEKVNRTIAFNKEIGTYDTLEGYYIKNRKAELAKQYRTAAS